MLKKALAILGSLAVIGVGVSSAQTPGQARKRAEFQKRAETRAELRYRFVDENGDGINDLFRDYDGDGIPNCQDPDWAPPKDGSGYKEGAGNGGNGPHGFFGNMSGFAGGGPGLNKGAFRQGRGGLRGGICDGSGPKGASRRGPSR
jgi:hypothetical protein